MNSAALTFPPGIAIVHEFHNGAGTDFAPMYAAERFLEACGFSIGHCQRGSPRGILFGDFDIQKWRNLTEADREALHGTMTGDMRAGPVTITIFETAPEEGRNAICAAISEALTQSPPSHPPQPGRSHTEVVSNRSGGPGAAEPAECPDAAWLTVAKQAPQPLIPPDKMVTPFRWIDNGAGVAAILDAHGRSVTFIRLCEAEGYVHWRNMQGW